HPRGGQQLRWLGGGGSRRDRAPAARGRGDRLRGGGGREARPGDLPPRARARRRPPRAGAARGGLVSRGRRRCARGRPACRAARPVRRLARGGVRPERRPDVAHGGAARRARRSAVSDEDVTYTRDGDVLKAYAVSPDGPPPAGAVIVIPDVRGLGEHYREIAPPLPPPGVPP